MGWWGSYCYHVSWAGDGEAHSVTFFIPATFFFAGNTLFLLIDGEAEVEVDGRWMGFVRVLLLAFAVRVLLDFTAIMREEGMKIMGWMDEMSEDEDEYHRYYDS